jgi:hypothetical protein
MEKDKGRNGPDIKPSRQIGYSLGIDFDKHRILESGLFGQFRIDGSYLPTGSAAVAVEICDNG